MFNNVDSYNKINNNYLGYIEFLDVKVEIVLGITDDNLNKHHVCLDNESISLNNRVNKILAGHSINDVFGKLHKLKVGDTLKIVTFSTEYNYIIDEIVIVKKTDVDILKKESDLTLITCMINNDKRLIVKASLM